jgi:spore coat polysaccharide biosynthesis predicted glycosyltransferase SpsG
LRRFLNRKPQTTLNSKIGDIMQVANEIRNQIGNKALVMIGAKYLTAGDNYLNLRIGKNVKKVNNIKITLNDSDLYDIEYGWIHGTKYTVKNTESGVYFDMLHKSIEQNTGMYTSL